MKKKLNQNLIEKAIKGDQSAFSEIYFSLRGIIFGFASRMLGNSTLAEDITQETFIFFIENSHKYSADRGDLLSYLCGIARNKILHHFRRQRLQIETPSDENEFIIETEDLFARNPLNVLLDEELNEKVDTAIAKLPFLQREVIILREIEELSYEEISQIIETPLSAVKARLFRARRNLAKELEIYFTEKQESPKKEKQYEMC